jgi:hypothetical protein
MNKKKIIIWILVLIALVTIFILLYKPEKSFSRIELNKSSYVTNNTKYPYIDTIIHVGLDSIGIKGVAIQVRELTKESKAALGENVELKGALYGYGNQYLMFVSEGSRQNHISIVSHELIHLRQYYTNRLIYNGTFVYFDSVKYNLSDVDYFSRPWEKEAFEKETKLSNQIISKLYN